MFRLKHKLRYMWTLNFHSSMLQSYFFRIKNNWLLVRSSKILILNKFEIGYLVNRALVVKSLARQIGIKIYMRTLDINAPNARATLSASWSIFARCFLMWRNEFQTKIFKENAVYWTWAPKSWPKTLISDRIMKWSYAFFVRW